MEIRPRCSRPDPARDHLDHDSDAQVDPAPQRVLDHDAVARGGVERGRQLPGHAVERLEDLADGLAEPLGRVLHARRLQREAAIPGGRAAQAPVVEAAHEHEGEGDYRGRDQQEEERAVGGALRGDGCEDQPVAGAPALREAAADEHGGDGVDHLDHRHREDAQEDAAGGEPGEPQALQAAGVMRLAELLLARPAEEDHAEELHHDVARERGHEHDARREHRHEHAQVRVGQPPGEEEALQQEPLGDEAVGRRQARARDHADQRGPGDPRHVAHEAAQLAEVPFLGGVQHRAGAEEEQALEERVVEAVVEGGDQRERRERMHLVGGEDDREPETHHDEADVLDRRIGEQALHVHLGGGEDHAEEGGREPQGKGDHAPPPDRGAEQVEVHPHQAVDRGLQHHPAHERRYGRGRGGVRFGKPDVQRKDSRLGAEAEERQQERAGGPERREVLRAHVGEGVVAGVGLQHAEAEQDRDGADVRDEQVEVAGAPDLGDAVVGRDQEERGERHHLPRDHEGVGVVGEQHQRHAGEEEVVVQAQEPRRRALAAAEVAAGENGDARAREAQQGQEEGGQRVQAQVEGQVRQADREHGGLRRAGHGGERDARQREAQRRPKSGNSTRATSLKLCSAATPANPIANQATTTSMAPSIASSDGNGSIAALTPGRQRGSHRLHGDVEEVARAALGADECGLVGLLLDLAAQPQDLHVDRAVVDVVVQAARLEQLVAREHALRRAQEGDQQARTRCW